MSGSSPMLPVVYPNGNVQTVDRALWVKKSKVKRCQAPDCTTEFSLTKPRHHCNCCGRVCCGPCVSNKIALPPLHPKPVNVCVTCFALVKNSGGSFDTAEPEEPAVDLSASASSTASPTRATSFQVPPTQGGLDRASLEGVEARLVELETKGDILRSENTTLQEQLAEATAKIQTTESELQTTKEQLEGAEADVRATKEVGERNAARTATTMSALEQRTVALTEAEEANREHADTLDRRERDLDSQREQLKRDREALKEARKAAVRDDREHERRQRSEDRDRAAALESKLAAAEDELAVTLRNRDADVAAERSFMEEKEQRLAKEQESLLERTATLGKHEAQLRESEAQIAAAQRRLKEQQAALETSHAELAATRRDVEQRRAAIDEHVSELEEVRNGVDADLAKVTADRRSLRREQAEWEEKKQVIEAELQRERMALAEQQQQQQQQQQVSSASSFVAPSLASVEQHFNGLVEAVEAHRLESGNAVSQAFAAAEAAHVVAVARREEECATAMSAMQEAEDRLLKNKKALDLQKKELKEGQLRLARQEENVRRQQLEMSRQPPGPSPVSGGRSRSRRGSVAGPDSLAGTATPSSSPQHSAASPAQQETQRLKAWSEELREREERLSDGARRAQEALRAKTEQLKAVQLKLDARQEEVQAYARSVGAPDAPPIRQSSLDAGALPPPPRAVGRFTVAHQSVVPTSPMDLVGLDASAPCSFPVELGDWGTDVFDLAERDSAFAAEPLTSVAFAVTEAWKLNNIAVPANTWISCLRALERQHGQNGKSSALRAAQTVHAAHAMLVLHPELLDALSSVELLAVVFAAAIHGVADVGLSNPYLVRTLDPTALRAAFHSPKQYADLSVAFTLVQQSRFDVTTLLAEAEVLRFASLVSRMVLAADVDTQDAAAAEAELLAARREYRLEANPAQRGTLLALLLRGAALAPATQAEPIYTRWCRHDEAQRQAEEERERQRGLEPLPDARSPPRTTLRFLNTVVLPVYSAIQAAWPPAAVLTPWSTLTSRRIAMGGEEDAAWSSAPRSFEGALEQLREAQRRVEVLESQGMLPSSQAQRRHTTASAAEAHLEELEERIAERQQRLQSLEDLTDRLEATEGTMATLLNHLADARNRAATPDVATFSQGGSEIPSQQDLVDAAAVIAQRESTARAKLIEASRDVARATTQREAAELAQREANDTLAHAKRMKAEAGAVLAREQQLERLQRWVESNAARAGHTALLSLAAEEGTRRVNVAAEEVQARLQAVQRRAVDVQQLYTQADTAARILDMRVAREKAIQTAIDAARERRRAVAQARVLNNATGAEPWHALERQLFAFTDSVTQLADQKDG